VPDNIGLLYHKHLAMFGPREMLLSSEAPVVRQFLNALRQGPIGMAEEKDANELEAEAAAGVEMPPLPPIPLQLPPTDGRERASQRPPGEWCRQNGVAPPPGSFQNGTAAPTGSAAGAPSSSPSPWASDNTQTITFPRGEY
jgi:phospholipid/cholesterol/gamma-HCH transport system ATP-binding protein